MTVAAVVVATSSPTRRASRRSGPTRGTIDEPNYGPPLDAEPATIGPVLDRYSRTAATRRWVSPSSTRPNFEKIELMCFCTACSLIASVEATEPVVLTGGHLAQDLQFAWRKCGERCVDLPELAEHERVDHLVANDRTTVGDHGDGVHEVLDIVGPVLQHVAPSARTFTQQRECQHRLEILGEGEHADAWVSAPQQIRRLHPLVGSCRRHADVCQHHVGLLGFDSLQEFVEISADGEDLHSPGGDQ
jgi:hypothetical protein